MSVPSSKEIHVIWWRYLDGSASGVLRAYADKERAEEDLLLLEYDECGREYIITTVPIYGRGIYAALKDEDDG